MKRDLYAEVSARIVAELEAGAAPWVKPWSATPGANTPCNAVSNRPYSGCNVVLLWMAQAAGYRTPRFLTFKQALESGGNVRKGERGTKVYFVKQLQVRDQGGRGPGHVISDYYSHWKGLGEKQLSFPLAKLRELSATVAHRDRVQRRKVAASLKKRANR
jgi:antirestriction protein ArdC